MSEDISYDDSGIMFYKKNSLTTEGIIQEIYCDNIKDDGTPTYYFTIVVETSSHNVRKLSFHDIDICRIYLTYDDMTILKNFIKYFHNLIDLQIKLYGQSNMINMYHDMVNTINLCEKYIKRNHRYPTNHH